MMTRRASLTNAPTPSVSIPFCLSTSVATCDAELPTEAACTEPAAACPSKLEEPQHQSHTNTKHEMHIGVRRPAALMRLAAPRHELIWGSTRPNSETTVATDARAA